MTFCTMTAVAVKCMAEIHRPRSMWDIGNQRFTAVGHGDFTSTGDFYRALGIEYRALDINDLMEADVVDMNYPVDRPPRELVVNNGTSEHIFNQAQVFENIHDLSSHLMLHVLPFTPWLNHGFYNYNPGLFRDLAYVNDYRMEFIWIGNRNGQYVDFSNTDFVFDGKRANMLRNALSDTPEATGYFVVTLLSKRRDAKFRYPIQGRYKGDIQNQNMANAYNPS